MIAIQKVMEMARLQLEQEKMKFEEQERKKNWKWKKEKWVRKRVGTKRVRCQTTNNKGKVRKAWLINLRHTIWCHQEYYTGFKV